MTKRKKTEGVPSVPTADEPMGATVERLLKQADVQEGIESAVREHAVPCMFVSIVADLMGHESPEVRRAVGQALQRRALEQLQPLTVDEVKREVLRRAEPIASMCSTRDRARGADRELMREVLRDVLSAPRARHLWLDGRPPEASDKMIDRLIAALAARKGPGRPRKGSASGGVPAAVADLFAELKLERKTGNATERARRFVMANRLPEHYLDAARLGSVRPRK